MPLTFTCNVCGSVVRDCPDEKIDREKASCPSCGSTVRVRSVVHLLSVALFGRSMPLPDFQNDKAISGIGLSDWHGYAERLSAKFDYRNTFFHREPRLDITRPHGEPVDFLISSEVFEHVPPPAQRAFDGAFRLLKPGGHLILTVPYGLQGETTEHFPSLREYRTLELGGSHVLVNRREDGAIETFTDLVFHGGAGETLEMRVFCERAVTRHLQVAGFDDVSIMRDPVPEFGIIHRVAWSLPILARRPISSTSQPQL